MKNPTLTLLWHFTGMIFASIAWWTAAVGIGLALYHYFPASNSITNSADTGNSFSLMAGVSLGTHWQNIPGNIFGFLFALYTFRALCPKVKTERTKTPA